MSSELAVVTAEIVDILPRAQQTPEMEKWVGDQLTQGNSVSDLLAYCKDSFGIVAHKIEAVESKLVRQGIEIRAEIKHLAQYTDQKFEAVNSKVAELQTQLAVTTALSNERSQQQAQTNNQLFGSLNQTNQNLVQGLTTVATKPRSETDYVSLVSGLAFGVILISCMAALVIKPAKDTQVIEYKNVPTNGFPKPVPKDLYDKI